MLSDRFQSAGVDPMRIQANGMGASNPLAPNTTVAGQKKNRRVEITFTSPSRKSRGELVGSFSRRFAQDKQLI